MPDLQRRARALQRISHIQQVLTNLQGEVVDIAQELAAAGFNGEGIMTETGMQLISVIEAASQAKASV